MDFDPTIFAVGGVSLLVLIFGLVEFFKSIFNLSGKAVTILSAVMGILFMVTYQLRGVLPEPYSQIYQIIVISLTFGLSVSGIYKFASPRLPPRRS